MTTAADRFALLVVDDEPQMRRLLASLFSESGYAVLCAAGGAEALSIAARVRIDAVLLDLVMPEMDGLEVLKSMRRLHPETLVMMMTGQGGIREAVKAIKQGALDFLEKPFSPESILARVGQLHRIWQLDHENRQLRERLVQRFDYPGLYGESGAMIKLKEMIAQVGPTDTTILIQGETGTGKELVARAIHHHSPRRRNPFVPVDCGAISQTVMESELFGHAKGAFTGAHAATLGLIRSANGGTLFLDEIGDLAPAIQVKLLRTIQEREVRPVGESRTYPVDVRILAATNRELAKDVSAGRFREDLFFRLNVLTVNIPPLRDHAEDIPGLAGLFLQRFVAGGSALRRLSPAALEVMKGYRWPGNVRELENTMRRAAALGRGDSLLPEDLPEPIFPGRTASGRKAIDAAGDTLTAYEIAAIRNALLKCGNNRSRTARLLGIGEATLYRKIKSLGIEPIGSPGRPASSKAGAAAGAGLRRSRNAPGLSSGGKSAKI
jgi:DNA-binding NtrC family response regulator